MRPGVAEDQETLWGHCVQDVDGAKTLLLIDCCLIEFWQRMVDTQTLLCDKGSTVESEVLPLHYNDVIMSAMASQITGIAMNCSTVCSATDQRKHQSFASLAFVRGIHQ